MPLRVVASSCQRVVTQAAEHPSMKPIINAAAIAELFARRGHLAYDGDGITQWQHAWQCGQLAREAAAAPELQLAAWLHDLGHLLTELDGTPTLHGHDDRHEALAAQLLRPLFGAAVAEPVALHVEAKRYLVAHSPGYRERLSPDSVRSLTLQGGAMNETERVVFLRNPYAADAIRLRAWDDIGKQPAWQPGADAELELIALMKAAGR
jgi:phosphonate degradation associated HDIG domain protein